MSQEKVWVWFKGGLNGGEWVSGFTSKNINSEYLLIEHPNYVSCKVPKWRILNSEPADLKKEPKIPTNAIWKLSK
tara:strand:+ start:5435 stop:5659 length:225 start_codon:yes stop_codon:yes gene_type:complete